MTTTTIDRPPAPSRHSEPSWRGRWIAAVGAGLAWVASLPPIGLWWLGPVAVALLGLAVRGLPLVRRATLGGMTGLVVFGATLRWATIFTVPGYVLLVLTQGAFVALAGLLVPRGRGWVLALPAALTLTEWLRHRWPLSGLPLSSLALGQADGPLLPLAAVGGPPLLTLTAAAIGALAVLGVRRRAAGTARGLVVAVGSFALLALAGPLLPTALGTSGTGRSLDVAAVQGGGRRGLAAARSEDTDVLARHLTTTREIDADIDLVLWPENVIDVDGSQLDGPTVDAVSSVAQALGAPLVAGVTLDAAPSTEDRPGVRRFRNLAVVFGSDGQVGPTYDKVVRVPFGEYVPLRPVIDRIADLSLIPRDAVPGSGPGVLDTQLGRLGVMVSFEGLYADRARDAVAAGATVLLVPTNASSYVTADVPEQQVAAARLRAIETGRWVVLAGPTGPAAMVGPDGDVAARSDLEEQTVVIGRVDLRQGRTPYGRAGDLPTLLVAGAALLAAHRPDWRSGNDLGGPHTVDAGEDRHA